MKPLSTTSTDIDAPHPFTHDEIAQRARELWESHGRPADRDQEIWLEAERTLHAEAAPHATEAAQSADTEIQLKTPAERETESAKSKPRTRARVARGRAAS